jgi:hypothetical protein
MKNMENKYWFAEESSNASANSIIVDVYTRQDDEHIGTIQLIYSFDKRNNYEEWTIESTEWIKDLTLEECDEAMQELLDSATENFHEFAFECYNYDPREDDDEWWCV